MGTSAYVNGGDGELRTTVYPSYFAPIAAKLRQRAFQTICKFRFFAKFDSIDSIIFSIRSIASPLAAVDRPGDASSEKCVAECQAGSASMVQSQKVNRGPGFMCFQDCFDAADTCKEKCGPADKECEDACNQGGRRSIRSIIGRFDNFDNSIRSIIFSASKNRNLQIV